MGIDTLAARVRRAIRAARGGKGPEQPDLEPRTEADAAEAFAAAKGWLAFGDEAAYAALLLDRAS